MLRGITVNFKIKYTKERLWQRYQNGFEKLKP